MLRCARLLINKVKKNEMKKTILKITFEDYSGSKSIVTVEEDNDKYLSCVKFLTPIDKDRELSLSAKCAIDLVKMMTK